MYSYWLQACVWLVWKKNSSVWKRARTWTRLWEKRRNTSVQETSDFSNEWKPYLWNLSCGSYSWADFLYTPWTGKWYVRVAIAAALAHDQRSDTALSFCWRKSKYWHRDLGAKRKKWCRFQCVKNVYSGKRTGRQSLVCLKVVEQ